MLLLEDKKRQDEGSCSCDLAAYFKDRGRGRSTMTSRIGAIKDHISLPVAFGLFISTSLSEPGVEKQNQGDEYQDDVRITSLSKRCNSFCSTSPHQSGCINELSFWRLSLCHSVHTLLGLSLLSGGFHRSCRSKEYRYTPLCRSSVAGRVQATGDL